MEFHINKNSTLPVLKLELINDGRNDFRKFNDKIQNATIISHEQIYPYLEEECVNLDENGNMCLVDCELKHGERVLIKFKNELVLCNSLDLQVYNIILLFPLF